MGEDSSCQGHEFLLAQPLSQTLIMEITGEVSQEGVQTRRITGGHCGCMALRVSRRQTQGLHAAYQAIAGPQEMWPSAASSCKIAAAVQRPADRSDLLPQQEGPLQLGTTRAPSAAYVGAVSKKLPSPVVPQQLPGSSEPSSPSSKYLFYGWH